MRHNGEMGTRIDLAKYRIEKAKTDLNSAKILFNANDCKGANNRAYYAIFHALEAVHALDGNSYRSHKETISNFNKEYVKTEVFPREVGRKIAGAEETRRNPILGQLRVISLALVLCRNNYYCNYNPIECNIHSRSIFFPPFSFVLCCFFVSDEIVTH